MNTPKTVIKTVILFSNNMVMAFDDAGQQIDQYQGEHETVASALKDLNLDDCEFQFGQWGRAIQTITRAEFFNHPGHIVTTEFPASAHEAYRPEA